MAQNSTGRIRTVIPVIAATSYAFSPQDDLAVVSAIPLGGTELVLPEHPSAGDEYSWGDVDGSCSSTRPLTLVAQGAMVRGGSQLVLNSPFSAGKAVYDAENDTWTIVSLTNAAPDGGSAVFGGVELIAAATTDTLARANVQTLWLLGANNALTLPPGPVDGDVVVLRLLASAAFFGTLAGNGKLVEPPNQMGATAAAVNLGAGPATLVYQFSANEAGGQWSCISNSVAFRPVLPWTSISIDPQNESTGATDQTPNPTALAPIATVAELNRRLLGVDVTSPTAIDFLSDVNPNDAALDLSGVRVLGAGSLTINGTPQVTHAGGSFTATTAIDVAINQSQTVTDSALGTFVPFRAQLVHDTTQGSYAWVSRAGTTTVNTSNPVTSAAAQSSFDTGDAYQIQRGSKLALMSLPVIAPNTLAAETVTFNDFLLQVTPNAPVSSVVADNGGSATFNRCAFSSTFTGLPAFAFTFNNCAFLSGLRTGAAIVQIFAGYWFSTATDLIQNLQIGTSAYVEGFGIACGVNPNFFGCAQIQVLNTGMQFQNTTGTAAIQLNVGGVLSAELGNLWGQGNALGMLIGVGVTQSVSSQGGVAPTVTGTGGDFAFAVPNGAGVPAGSQAYQIGIAGGAVTATETSCSWANLYALTGAAGKNLQRPDANSAIMVN
jgi:hypothetical protein